jgi:adenine-specific DNA-methyltransferase
MPEIVFKGKEYVYNHHLTVPYRPLVPHADKGIGPGDLAGNLVIHGDNLHALKSLLPRYAGKVDLIFIDPPYNTGNEGWCYSDGVNSPIMKEWLSTNPVDGDDMLRHDKWLCMMWPRLVLLRELLSERGVLAICIDENEVHRLYSLALEILGEESYLGSIVWKTRNTDNRVLSKLSIDHEYVLLFSRSAGVQGRVIARDDFKNPDNDKRGNYVTDPLTGKATATQRPNLHYPITNELTGDVYQPDPARGWITDAPGFAQLLNDKRVWWPESPERGNPRKKRFLTETSERMPASSFWSDLKGQSGADEVDRILGARLFDFPKALEFAERVVDLCAPSDALILDSFAGSGTTAHAVLKANAKDGGTRRFILVEGEDYADTLTAERVRRAINGYAWVGNQRETLLEEKITFTQFKKADEWLKKVETIKAREGFADGDLADQGTIKTKRFDKITTKLDDGVLRVEGERRISERMEGLGGEFTYCTLGEPLNLEKLLSGEHLPAFDALGAWLFHTATGGTLPPLPKGAAPWYLGEAQDKHLWLVYRPELAFLKSPDAALTLTLARTLQTWGTTRADGKPHLVFAPAKYMSNRQLLDHGISYAPLPFALYREA